jgi:hypothetical protein
VVGDNNREQIEIAIPVETARIHLQGLTKRAALLRLWKLPAFSRLRKLGENVFSQSMSSSSLASLFLAPMLPSPVQGSFNSSLCSQN